MYRFPFSLLRSVSVASLALAAPALAQELADDADATIVVLAPEYSEGRITSATKTETPLLDVPQTISVVTRDLIDDRAMLSIGDAVRYVPGITVGQGEGNRDQITLRGNNTTADFFVNGVRDDVQYFRDFYNIERIEVLKGPNAMIFGRGGGGGVVNRVTKTPQAAAWIGGSAAVDTYGSVRFDADINQPLGDTVAVRINGVYENAETHRDFYELERYAVNPTIAWQFGERTRIGLSYEYVNDYRVTDRGVPAARAGTIADPAPPLAGFDKTFFGVPGINRADLEANVLTFDFEHRFNDTLLVRNRTLYGDYDKYYRNAFASGAVASNGTTVPVQAYFDRTQRENLFSQTDLILKAQTGGIDHVLLAGVEVGTQDTSNGRLNGFFDPVVNTATTTVTLADRIVFPTIYFRGGAGTGQRSTTTDADIFAAYVQDQIAFGSHFDIVAGIRYDHFKLDARNLLTGASFGRTDNLWSPRLGLIYKPVEPVSIYASYSRSYLPQSGDQFTSLDLTSEALKPERFDNYEIGLKWDVLEELQLTAALYQLDRTNTRATDPVTGAVVQTGEQRSKGLELGLVGKVTQQWQVSAGYALQDAEIKRTTSAAPAGRNVAQVPRHQVSLWNRYNVTDWLGLGLGVYHQTKMFASISNVVVVPAYTRVDAALFVKFAEGWEAQVNVENLLDEDYFVSAHNDNNISPGGPTSARLTLRTRF